MKARARSGAHATERGRRATARRAAPSRVAPSLQIAFAPLEAFEPLPPATNLVELLRATLHRVAERFTECSLAVSEGGGPVLPEMPSAARWSGWGAWFVECERAEGIGITERFEGEELLKAAFERRRRVIGFPKSRYLNQAEILIALSEALAYAEHWGRA